MNDRFPTLAASLRLILAAVVLLAANLAPLSRRVTGGIAAGDQAAGAGNTAAAQAAYGRALRHAGPAPAVYERLIQLSLESHQPENARLYLYALADLDGWTAERRFQLAALLAERDQEEQAAALLYAGASGAQTDPAALRTLAGQQIARQDWSQAQSTLERLIALEPQDARALYQLGLLLAPVHRVQAETYLLQARQDPALAGPVERVLAALSTYADHPATDAHTFLGMTLAGLGEWPFAERALMLALAANAVNPTARAYLGFVRDQQGRDGLPDLEAAVEMAPNDPVAYYLLGQHWTLAEDDRAAYETFAQAFALDPDNPALAVEVAAALHRMGNLAEAADWYDVAVELDPDEPNWYVLRAAFYADAAFMLDAGGLALIEEAAQLVPDSPDAHASLGWAAYQTGDYARAYEEFNAALGLDPHHARSRYYFGAVLEQRGDRNGAADAYQFVVDQVGADRGFGRLAARALERLGYGSF